MRRREVDIDGGAVLAYGHYGRPVLAFPSENGEVWDWEARGMIDALAEPLEAGRMKLYCIPSFDRESWTRRDLGLEERARRRGDLFPVAVGVSGVYDVSVQGGGERGEAVYFNNPMDYVTHLGGDHLDWLRSQVSIVLVCGQGQWEDSTGALDSTRRFGSLLGEKGIRHEVDLWGHDVPHDWPSWRRQVAHHLPRFL
jgi:esterase/lipase superfamily enzyme